MRLALLFAAVIAALPVAAAMAQDRGVTGDPATLRDFMIQNVCLDAAGAAVVGRSPLDADCLRQRDLLPGELLPYHKHDHPSPAQQATMPRGYQRHDSYPVETAGLGTVIEHSFDFGDSEGQRFGRFDGRSEGGDVAVVSPSAASIVATTDGQGGFGLWVGECRGAIDPAALARSWVIAQYDPNRPVPLAGETVARLNGLPGGAPLACPARYNPAYTTWRVAPFRYRAAPGQGMPVTLTTLISDHYGGLAPASADHVERFYFTRELGGTRWERWQNIAGNREMSAAEIDRRAAEMAASGRCSQAERPPGGAPLVLIDCREWTRIVFPDNAAGDRPGFFIERIRAQPDMPPFFAPPPR